MKEVTVKLYQFDELSEPAKERARQWWRDCENQDFGGHGELYESAVTVAKILGVTFADNPVTLMGGGTRVEPKIYWGLHTQGSGASFEGRYNYAKQSAKKIREEFPKDKALHAIADTLAELQKRHKYQISAKIEQRGNSVHAMSMDAEVYRDGDYAPEDVAETVLEAMRDFARWIYKGIEEEYDYRMTDENVDESIRANEYDFRENGERSDD